MWESGLGSGETCGDTPSDPQTEDPRAGLEVLNAMESHSVYVEKLVHPKRYKLV